MSSGLWLPFFQPIQRDIAMSYSSSKPDYDAFIVALCMQYATRNIMIQSLGLLHLSDFFHRAALSDCLPRPSH